MFSKANISQKVTALLVYGRPPLVFGGLLCALGIMWSRSPGLYLLGVAFLFVAMTFDLVDGWFAARFAPHSALADLADRTMDKVVYDIIFPLIAVGMFWRLHFTAPAYYKTGLLHALFILIVCVTVLVRDSFAHFMRGFALRKGQDIESKELARIRTIVAAPVAAILYAYAFYVPEGPSSPWYAWLSWLGTLPLRDLFFIEIVFLIINFGSIAGYARKYGAYCLEELCLADELLRRKILSFFPNSLTVMNAIMGLLSVFFAYQGRIREAYLILIGAALFDKLDGALARRLGLTEPLPEPQAQRRVTLGGILDDVADAVSFCMAPAWIFYLTLAVLPGPLLGGLPIGVVALLYAFLGIARLVYFTVDPKPIPGFFKGMPTPAAALLVTAPLIMFSQAFMAGHMEAARLWGIFCFGLMILAGMLMNLYPVRYLHLGRLMTRSPVFGRITAILLVTTVFTPYFGHLAFAYMCLYMLSPLVTWRIRPEVAARETRERKGGD